MTKPGRLLEGTAAPGSSMNIHRVTEGVTAAICSASGRVSASMKIVVSPNMQIYPQVSCDGQNHFTCAPGDTVTVSKKPQKLRLIHPIDHNYYEVCRTKLGWGSRLGSSE